MAAPMICDLGCTNEAMVIITMLANGDTLALCDVHFPVWIDELGKAVPHPAPEGAEPESHGYSSLGEGGEQSPPFPPDENGELAVHTEHPPAQTVDAEETQQTTVTD